MESEDKKNEKDDESSSKHVLDYYKKYSQNRELPKYFSGTSVSYIPEIVENVDYHDFKQSGFKENVEDHDEEQVKDISRASSVMSNRKLEWDNGADIGYDNCQKIHKSASLPLLSDLKMSKIKSKVSENVKIVVVANSSDSEKEKSGKIVHLTSSSSSDLVEKTALVSSTSTGSNNVKNLVSSSSSSDSRNCNVQNNKLTSSSSNSSGERKTTKFAETLSYLKQKIGVPDAHSTPKLLEDEKGNTEVIGATPFVKKPIKPPRKHYDEKRKSKLRRKVSSLENLHASSSNNSFKRTNSCEILSSRKPVVEFKKSAVINLHLTKPVTVECLDLPIKSVNINKKVQTSLLNQSSKSVQTEPIVTDGTNLSKFKTIGARNKKNQSIVYLEYPENDNNSNTCSTQTSSELVASNCDSFEFVKNHQQEKANKNNETSTSSSKNDEDSNKQATSVPIQEYTNSNLQRSQRKLNLTAAASDNDSSSTQCFLGNLISASQSDFLSEGVEKSLELLQKLIKSKKYDSVTKKRYIKKIIRKIATSNYMEESSTSSELFFPKTAKSNIETFATKPNHASTTSDSSDPKLQENSLQSNRPWFPIVQTSNRASPKKHGKLDFKTFSDEIQPKSQAPVQIQSSKEDSIQAEIIPVDTRKNKKLTRFTLTNNEFSVNHNTTAAGSTKTDIDSLYATVPKPEEDASLQQYESSSASKSSVSYQNWKDDQTMSEKRFEDRVQGEGDYLVQFAKKERQHQILWINNEISHLSKLKILLERPCQKKSTSDNSDVSASKQPTNGTTKLKKTTTTYVVSSSNGDNAKPRNYIIETQLGTDSSKSPIDFHLGNQNYIVKEINSKNNINPDRMQHQRVVGEIEVVSDESTTKLKINTMCKACKKTPCICIPDIYKNFTCLMCNTPDCMCYPHRSGYCSLCKRCPCMCAKRVQPKSCPKCQQETCLCSYKCQCCHKYPCMCLGKTQQKTTCILCQRCPCICGDYSRKMSFEFVPKEPCLYSSSTNAAGACGGPKQCNCALIKKLKDFCDECCLANDSEKKKCDHSNTINLQISNNGNTHQPTPGEPSEPDNICTQTDCKCKCCNAAVQTKLRQLTSDKVTNYEGPSVDKMGVGTSTGIPRADLTSTSTSSAHSETSNDARSSTEEYDPGNNTSENDLIICACCKNQNVAEDVSMLVSEHRYPLCHTCVEKNPGVTTICYDSAEHICTCYTELNTNNINKLQEKKKLQKVTYCSCVDPSESDQLNNRKGPIKVQCDCGEKLQRQTESKIRSHSNSLNNKKKSQSVDEPRQVKSTRNSSLKKKKRHKDRYDSFDETDDQPQYKAKIKSSHVGNLNNKQITEQEDLKTKRSSTKNREKPYCSCGDTSSIKSNKCCSYCECKLKNTAKNNVGIAYSLILENESPSRRKLSPKNSRKKKQSLEEILVKVPCPHYKKNNKNGYRTEEQKRPAVKKVNKDRDNFHKRQDSLEGVNIVNINSPIETDGVSETSSKNTLQEYLNKNRPDFIESAEFRRNSLLDSRVQRELTSEEIKLKFLNENMRIRNSKDINKLFTDKEMKEINKKNYKKLPEVQEKLNRRRDQQLRDANKLIVDLFAKKLQYSVLKGKRNFPIDTRVVNLTCTNSK